MLKLFERFFKKSDGIFDEEYEKLVKEGKINPQKFSYKYQKPKILETMKGSYGAWEKEMVKEAKLITILGKRRVGKTALCMNQSENLAVKKKTTIQTVGMSDVELPPFISDIEGIEGVDNDSILAVGEGAIEANSRRSMSKGSINLGRLLPIISHKNVWILWCSQSGQKTDKNTIFEADTIMLMKPSLMQVNGERKVLKDLYIKYEPYIDKWAKKIGSYKGVCVVYSDAFIGVIRGKLPSFWSNEISKSYAHQGVMT